MRALKQSLGGPVMAPFMDGHCAPGGEPHMYPGLGDDFNRGLPGNFTGINCMIKVSSTGDCRNINNHNSPGLKQAK